jgi:hypothetical protein
VVLHIVLRKLTLWDEKFREIQVEHTSEISLSSLGMMSRRIPVDAVHFCTHTDKLERENGTGMRNAAYGQSSGMPTEDGNYFS